MLIMSRADGGGGMPGNGCGAKEEDMGVRVFGLLEETAKGRIAAKLSRASIVALSPEVNALSVFVIF